VPTLEFKGKQHIYAHHLTVPYRPLKPDPSKSIFSTDIQNGGGGTAVLNRLCQTEISSSTATTCTR
jgi:hypothetical protein